MNGLSFIGPVKVDWHSQPQWSWDGPTGADGLRTLKISGEFEWDTVGQLSELQANEDAKKTQGSRRGVPVVIWTENAPELSQFHGAYLFEDFSLSAGVDQSRDGLPTGTITAAYLGDGVEYVVTRGAFPKGNDFGLTAKSLVVSPIRPSDDAGDRFLVDPGGTFGTREYDPTYPYDPAVPTPAGGTARIGLYVGTVTDDVDELEEIVYPKIQLGKDTPAWLVDQGGMVRARDRRLRREVYGPHTFHESTDLQLTNGLVSFWVGNRGLVPFLNVQAVVDGSRREVGVVQLGETAVLTRARLQYITTEFAVVALTIDGYGDALVAMRRGDPGLTVVSPSSSIRPRWRGTPPTSWLESASNAAGRFGNGLNGGDDAYESDRPNMRLLWPPTVAAEEWAKAFWWTPDAASTELGDAGLWTLHDEDGIAIARIWFDGATSGLRFTVGSQTLLSPAITFDIEDDLCIGARFSSELGMALSVGRPDGTVIHAFDGTATVVPGGTPTEFGYFVNFSAWGDPEPPWGDDDDVWGGITSYPGGVIDNDMIFGRRFDNDRFEALATAETPLGGLGDDEGDLEWYGPFDVEPIPVFDAEAGGRVEAVEPDEFDLTRVVARLSASEWAVYLAREADGLTTALALHEQSAAESPQDVLRGRR